MRERPISFRRGKKRVLDPKESRQRGISFPPLESPQPTKEGAPLRRFPLLENPLRIARRGDCASGPTLSVKTGKAGFASSPGGRAKIPRLRLSPPLGMTGVGDGAGLPSPVHDPRQRQAKQLRAETAATVHSTLAPR